MSWTNRILSDFKSLNIIPWWWKTDRAFITYNKISFKRSSDDPLLFINLSRLPLLAYSRTNIAELIKAWADYYDRGVVLLHESSHSSNGRGSYRPQMIGGSSKRWNNLCEIGI